MEEGAIAPEPASHSLISVRVLWHQPRFCASTPLVHKHRKKRIRDLTRPPRFADRRSSLGTRGLRLLFPTTPHRSSSRGLRTASRSSSRPIAPAAVDLRDRIERTGWRRERRPSRTGVRVRHIQALPCIRHLYGANDCPSHRRPGGPIVRSKSGGVTLMTLKLPLACDGTTPGKGFVRESRVVDVSARHLRLLTETIAAVNSTLDLEEVLGLVASKVADALEADACFVYLYDERAGRARAARDARHARRGDDARAADAPGRRDHRHRCGRARAGDDPRAGAPRPALQGSSRTCPRTSTSRSSRCRSSPGSSSRARSTSARVEPREFTRRRDRAAASRSRPGRADDRAREALRRGAAAGRRARGAGADLGGRLRVALPRGVARGDREDDDGSGGRDRRGARARGRQHRLAGGPRGRPRRPPAAALEAAPDRRARLRPRHAVHRRGARAARRRSPTTRRSRSSTGAP